MESLAGIKKSIYYISFPLAFMGFILPFYAAETGASIMEIGLLYSIFSLCSIIIRPFVGKWIDIKGRRSGFIFGLTLYSLVALIFFLGNSYGYLLIAKVFQSIAGGFLWISINAMVSDLSNDKDRSQNFGYVEQISNRGAMFGSFIGFTILLNINSSDSFKLVFLVYLVISIIALYYGITNSQETLRIEEDNTDRNQSQFEGNSKKFKYFLATIMILSLVSSMMAPVYLVYLREHITSDFFLISLLYIPGAFLSLYLPRRFGLLSDRFGRKRLLTLGMAIQCAVFFLIPIFKSYYVFLLAYTSLSIGSMLVGPARMSLVTELTGGNNRGRSYGLYSTAVGVGGVIGPIIGASVYQLFGYLSIFYVQGFTIFFSLLVINIILKDPVLESSYNIGE